MLRQLFEKCQHYTFYYCQILLCNDVQETSSDDNLALTSTILVYTSINMSLHPTVSQLDWWHNHLYLYGETFKKTPSHVSWNTFDYSFVLNIKHAWYVSLGPFIIIFI